MTTTVFEHTEKIENIETLDIFGDENEECELIVEFGNENKVDPCFFIWLQSWDETKQHDFLKSLLGKQVKITIEIVD